jgi:fumarylpyruvate hydrolase
VSIYVVAPPPVHTIPVQGDSSLFPVRRVFCVGRNYAEHAREMGFSDRDPPFFFCKPADAVVAVPDGAEAVLSYPARTGDFQHEIELVVAIGRAGRDIAPADANQHVWGYAVGLDMTRRDRQLEMRAQGRPWEIGKSFEQSAVVGALRRRDGNDPLLGRIWLDVDGARRQQSTIGAMIWSVPEVIAHLSCWFDLQAGDIVFTGTPAGVGPVVPGQALIGGIEGLRELRAVIGACEGVTGVDRRIVA